MQNPKISIVIPSYNKARYIAKTLDSILEQKYNDLEVIIQDPGSTDGSLDIIKKYAEKYPKMIFLYKEKDSGQLDAINRGLKKAKGDILTYINADDIYSKDSYKYVSEAYQNYHNALWFAGRGNVIDDEDKEIAGFITKYKNILLTLNSYYILLTTNYLMQPSVFLTKKAYKEYGNFKGTKQFVMEYEMWLRIGKVQMPVIIPKCLSSFRLPVASIYRNEYKKTLSEDYKIVQKFTQNPVILFLHNLHSFGRRIVIKIV